MCYGKLGDCWRTDAVSSCLELGRGLGLGAALFPTSHSTITCVIIHAAFSPSYTNSLTHHYHQTGVFSFLKDWEG